MSIISIPQLLSGDLVSRIRSTIADGPYGEAPKMFFGGGSAGRAHLQLDPRSQASARAAELLVAACRENSVFIAATWIEAMMAPMFYRYETGMASGDAIDPAFTGEPPHQLRCDVEITIFLADGSAYGGGELLVDASGVPRRWKGSAGDCLIYPAEMSRRVELVTAGVLDVAVFWVQSMVRDPAQRRILFDIKETLDDLDRLTPPPARTESLRRSYFNLIRMWA